MRRSGLAAQSRKRAYRMSYGQSPQPGFPSGRPGQFGFPPSAPPPKKSGAKGCILAAVGGVVLLLVGCCVAAWLGWNYIQGEVGRQIAEQLKDTQAMQENIGEVSSIEMELMKSAQLTQDAQADDPEKQIFFFNVQGSKGSGELVVETKQTGGPVEILKAELKLPDGRTVPVAP
jgi:hypothetical protein